MFSPLWWSLLIYSLLCCWLYLPNSLLEPVFWHSSMQCTDIQQRDNGQLASHNLAHWEYHFLFGTPSCPSYSFTIRSPILLPLPKILFFYGQTKPVEMTYHLVSCWHCFIHKNPGPLWHIVSPMLHYCFFCHSSQTACLQHSVECWTPCSCTQSCPAVA